MHGAAGDEVMPVGWDGGGPCTCSPFVFDTVRRAFGLVQCEGRQMKPSRLLLDEPVQCTQGLVLWAALKAQWKLPWAVKYQRRSVTCDEFVALWPSILEGLRGERDMSCSRVDPHHLIAQLQGCRAVAGQS